MLAVILGGSHSGEGTSAAAKEGRTLCLMHTGTHLRASALQRSRNNCIRLASTPHLLQWLLGKAERQLVCVWGGGTYALKQLLHPLTRN